MQKHNYHTYSQNRDENYWCETCDRGFGTFQLLKQHQSQHQVCKIDGCTFVAHPKVIIKHVQMQHSTGLFKKISKLSDPEEIKKWIEERKKKYPTKTNIEKKNAEFEAKVNRGETYGLKGVKRPNNNKDLDTKTEAKKPKRNRKRKKVIKHQEEPQQLEERNRNLIPFKGVQQIFNQIPSDTESLSESNNLDIVDEDETEPSAVEVPTNVCSALSSLISTYQSSDEEIVETKAQNYRTHPPNVVKPITKQSSLTTIKEVKQLLASTTPCEAKQSEVISNDSDSGPEEVKTKIERIQDHPSTAEVQLSDRIEKKNKSINVVTKNVRHQPESRRGNQVRKPRTSHPTLLERLLHGEIRHERNVVLQCIRYIRQNNYFE